MNKRLALLDAGYTIQREIDRLRRGMPISEAKAHTSLAKLETRKRYQTDIAKLRAQLKAVNAAIHG